MLDGELHNISQCHGSADAEMMPVEEDVPSVIRKFCVPTAGKVDAVAMNIVLVLLGTVVSVFVYVARPAAAPSVVYAVEVNNWKPLVNAIAGATRIGTGKDNVQTPAVVLVVVVHVVFGTKLTSVWLS